MLRFTAVCKNLPEFAWIAGSKIGAFLIPCRFREFTLNGKITGIKSTGKTLKSIEIPENIDGIEVTSIAQVALKGCDLLEKLTLPFIGENKDGSGETYFGYIFGAKSYPYNENFVPASLKEVIITGGTSIGSYAFSGCSGLTNITIPDSMTSIGNSAFSGCGGLKEVHITDLTVWCVTEFNNSVANPLYYAHNLYLNSELISDLVIPADVKNIGEYVFYNCSGLTSITIPDSVTSIGSSAFYGCSGLTSITIPNSVTSIGDYLFYGCSGLTSVTIGNGVTSIGYSAFQNCSGLTSITIPDSVTSIGSYAFYNGNNFTSVIFENPNGWWRSSINMSTSGTSISSSALADPSTAATYLKSTYAEYYWKRG